MILAALQQSALDPAGRQASIIHSLWWLFICICAAVYLLVLLCLLISLLRRTTTPQMPPPNLAEDPRQQRRLTNLIGGLIVLTTIILFVLLISDFVSGERVHALAKSADQIEIKVTAHQWWWDFDYQDPVRSQMVNTANEIHIPVGVPVQFDLNSADVIHSFWIPNLHGKKDMIPGHPTKVWLQADQAGTYYAQCAEFCGHQHAHMRFVVVAEDRYKYNQWLDDQRQPGREPKTEMQKRGRDVFLQNSCVLCHTIAGTRAGSHIGPNLTHIGSRPSIGAETRPNTVGHLAGWILDPQQIKPGVRMPQNNLSAKDLRALLEYLESLK